jgi:hypothetical protein
MVGCYAVLKIPDRLPIASVEVVGAQDLMSSVSQFFAQVRTQKAGTARYRTPLPRQQRLISPSPAISPQLPLTKA